MEWKICYGDVTRGFEHLPSKVYVQNHMLFYHQKSLFLLCLLTRPVDPSQICWQQRLRSCRNQQSVYHRSLESHFFSFWEVYPEVFSPRPVKGRLIMPVILLLRSALLNPLSRKERKKEWKWDHSWCQYGLANTGDKKLPTYHMFTYISFHTQKLRASFIQRIGNFHHITT